jgi:polysaccharide biosynthesis protein PslH
VTSAASSPLTLLVVATKPPWPPVDGGRLLLLQTLELLGGAGVRITCCAPCPRRQLAATAAALEPWCRPELVAARRRPLWRLLRGALFGGLPLSPARHHLPALARRVDRLLERESFAVVHAEQVQSFPQARPAERHGVPVVVRAQNVESELWRGAARGVPVPALLRWEARRLARWEGLVVARAAATVALTEVDRRLLQGLASGRRVWEIPAPFPAELPAGEPLPGEPAVLLLGSGGWRPNRQGAEAFLRHVWPAVKKQLPQSELHLFAPISGPPLEGVRRHPPPANSDRAFATGGILVVPLEVASGVRMKILEAWARGVPVVASPAAVAGLGAGDGEELLVAADGAQMVAAIAELHRNAELRLRLVAGGRRLLARRHDPAQVVAQYLELYGEVQARGARPS